MGEHLGGQTRWHRHHYIHTCYSVRVIIKGKQIAGRDETSSDRFVFFVGVIELVRFEMAEWTACDKQWVGSGLIFVLCTLQENNQLLFYLIFCLLRLSWLFVLNEVGGRGRGGVYCSEWHGHGFKGIVWRKKMMLKHGVLMRFVILWKQMVTLNVPCGVFFL